MSCRNNNGRRVFGLLLRQDIGATASNQKEKVSESIKINIMNQCIIIGNLGKDAEVKQVSSGYILEFSIAESYKTKNETRTFWHNVVRFFKEQPGLAPYLTKGSKVCVSGAYRYDDWQTQEGEKRRTYKLNAVVIELIHSTREEPHPAEVASAPTPFDNNDFDPELGF